MCVWIHGCASMNTFIGCSGSHCESLLVFNSTASSFYVIRLIRMWRSATLRLNSQALSDYNELFAPSRPFCFFFLNEKPGGDFAPFVFYFLQRCSVSLKNVAFSDFFKLVLNFWKHYNQKTLLSLSSWRVHNVMCSVNSGQGVKTVKLQCDKTMYLPIYILKSTVQKNVDLRCCCLSVVKLF